MLQTSIMKQSNNDEILCSKHNNAPVILVIMEGEIPFQDRLLCQICLKYNKQQTQMISLEGAKDLIQKQMMQRNSVLERLFNHSLENVQEIKQKFEKFRNHFIKLIDEVNEQFNELVGYIEQRRRDIQKMSLINELQMLLQKNQIQIEEEQLVSTIESYKGKIKLGISKLNISELNQIAQSFDKINQIKQEQQQCSNVSQQSLIPHKNNNKQSMVYELVSKNDQVEMINRVQQNEPSGALIFNVQGSIMISGSNQNIVVWDFNKGQLNQKETLLGHSQQVYCFAFSKKQNWFASGGRDAQIFGWREDKSWKRCQAKQSHTDSIMCLIINQSENQLISCSRDRNIIVWVMDCSTNSIDYCYTLVGGHKQGVDSMSINPSETALVSCSSKDRTIILWVKDIKGQWIFHTSIQIQYYGFRICFLDDQYFFWQQAKKGILYTFEITHGELKRKPISQIQLNRESNDYFLFPTIVNREKQMIIQRHNKYIYFLQYQDNGCLQMARDPINCNNMSNYGSVTVDGEYLVVWCAGAFEYQVYKITYNQQT